MNMGSVDLMVCQGSSNNIPYCQMGRDEQMNLDQPEELTEKMRLFEGLISLELSVDQQMQLTEKEDQNDILMIGGIKLFLPFAQEEAEGSVADDTTTAGEQSAMTIREEKELKNTLGASQVDEENQHSVECLNTFSQEAESDVALELKAEE